MHESFKKKVSNHMVRTKRLAINAPLFVGVFIKVLNSRIYPLYSVFRPPTYQEYLEFFSRMFNKHQLYNTTGPVLEIGKLITIMDIACRNKVIMFYINRSIRKWHRSAIFNHGATSYQQT